MFAQHRDGAGQQEKIELKWGKLRLRQLIFTLPQNAKPGKVTVRAAGKAIEATHGLQEKRLYIDLAADTILQAGEALEVTISLQ